MVGGHVACAFALRRTMEVSRRNASETATCLRRSPQLTVGGCIARCNGRSTRSGAVRLAQRRCVTSQRMHVTALVVSVALLLATTVTATPLSDLVVVPPCGWS